MPRRKGVKANGSAVDHGMRGAIASLRGYHGRLLAERQKLDARIAALEGALLAIGGGGGPTALGRPAAVAAPAAAARPAGVRAGSLKDFVLRVIRGKGEMAVKDITAAVIGAGFKSTNKTLAKSVGVALSELPGVERTGRGLFRLGK